MADVLIRNLDPSIVERMKRRAASQGRSMQAELRAAIEQAAAQMTREEAWRDATAFQRRTKARKFPDTTTLLRAARRRA